MMWGQYSSNATGFALEYEFDGENIITYLVNNTQNRIWANLFPVIYDNKSNGCFSTVFLPDFLPNQS